MGKHPHILFRVSFLTSILLYHCIVVGTTRRNDLKVIIYEFRYLLNHILNCLYICNCYYFDIIVCIY